MFLKLDTQTITLLLLALCIIPIAVLGIWAIVKSIKTAKSKNASYKENISHEELDYEQRALFYEAFGGESNVLEISTEMNRITFKTVDINKVDGERLKELGATGVLLVGDLVKVSFGDRAKYVYKLMEKVEK